MCCCCGDFLGGFGFDSYVLCLIWDLRDQSGCFVRLLLRLFEYYLLWVVTWCYCFVEGALFLCCRFAWLWGVLCYLWGLLSCLFVWFGQVGIYFGWIICVTLTVVLNALGGWVLGFN